MTLSEIRLRALEQAGEFEPMGSIQDRSLTQYINEGYASLCPDGTLETVQLTVTGGTAPLPAGFSELCCVTDALGNLRRFHISGGMIHLSPDGLYTARVMLALKPLTSMGEEPRIPEHLHGVLADYAAWRFLSTGGRPQQMRAEHYHQAFLLQKSQLQRQTDAARGARNRVNKYS